MGDDSGGLVLRGVDGCCCSSRWLTVRSLLMHAAIFPSTTTLHTPSVLVALSCRSTDDVLVPVSTQETRLFCAVEEFTSPPISTPGRSDVPPFCRPGTNPVFWFCRAFFSAEPFLIANDLCVNSDPEVESVSPSDDEADPSSEPSQMLSMRGQLPESRRCAARDAIVTDDAILFPVCLGARTERTKTSVGSASDARLTETDLSTRMIYANTPRTTYM